MRNDGIKAQVGYRKPRQRSGEVHVVTPNTLAREFNPSKPNHSWVTDITYIRTHEGWLYLGVVIDLYSRKVIGWSMDSRMVKELVLDALLMAVWRRKPESRVIVHSDQGSQYTSYEWQEFLEEHGLAGSMSRRGNCHDNAVAESFFQLLKRERIKKRVYLTRETAKRDIFNYIEMFYNPVRRHTANNLLSPQEFERRYKNEAEKCLLNYWRFSVCFRAHFQSPSTQSSHSDRIPHSAFRIPHSAFRIPYSVFRSLECNGSSSLSFQLVAIPLGTRCHLSQ